MPAEQVGLLRDNYLWKVSHCAVCLLYVSIQLHFRFLRWYGFCCCVWMSI